MFRCEDCGAVFEFPKAVQEDRGEFWGTPAFETMYYCPECDSECYDEYDGYDEYDDEDEWPELAEEEVWE